LDPTEQILPEDGDRFQSPKRCVLKYKQDGVLNKDNKMDNVQKRNIRTGISRQTEGHSFGDHLIRESVSVTPSIVKGASILL
jgi:hypothetical protein